MWARKILGLNCTGIICRPENFPKVPRYLHRLAWKSLRMVLTIYFIRLFQMVNKKDGFVPAVKSYVL